MSVPADTMRSLRQLEIHAFRSIVTYAASRCRAFTTKFREIMGDLSEEEMHDFLAHVELELNSATFFVGLGHLYHAGNVQAPPIIRKLVNLRSFNQLRDVMSISDIVSNPSMSEEPVLRRYESDWWSRFPEPSRTPLVTPQLIFEAWEKQKSMLPAVEHSTHQVQDCLQLLPLSRQDLHLAYSTTEQLLQEAAMESITTLEHIKMVDKGLAHLEGLLREVDHIELEMRST